MLQDEARVNRLSLVFDGVVKVVYRTLPPRNFILWGYIAEGYYEGSLLSSRVKCEVQIHETVSEPEYD